MAAGSLIPVDEYLRTTYRPDCDYIDGEVRERNMGEQSHGRLQALIAAWFYRHEAQWRLRVVTEVRLQIATTRFRIPDVMVLPGDAPREPIVRTPPLLCFEILSRDDRISGILGRARDYFEIGVPVCWIIDPIRNEAWEATPGETLKVSDGILRAGQIEMPLAEVLE